MAWIKCSSTSTKTISVIWRFRSKHHKFILRAALLCVDESPLLSSCFLAPRLLLQVSDAQRYRSLCSAWNHEQRRKQSSNSKRQQKGEKKNGKEEPSEGPKKRERSVVECGDAMAERRYISDGEWGTGERLCVAERKKAMLRREKNEKPMTTMRFDKEFSLILHTLHLSTQKIKSIPPSTPSSIHSLSRERQRTKNSEDGKTQRSRMTSTHHLLYVHSLPLDWIWNTQKVFVWSIFMELSFFFCSSAVYGCLIWAWILDLLRWIEYNFCDRVQNSLISFKIHLSGRFTLDAVERTLLDYSNFNTRTWIGHWGTKNKFTFSQCYEK